MKKKLNNLVAKCFRWRERNINREVKDRLFRFLFEKDREALLQLYNALNGTEYPDPSRLRIVTIENVVYITMKNDLAFVVAGVLNLYEHQSTCNPNMPVRFLIYLAQEYQKAIEEAEESLYGERQILLPTPQCIVFYNGEKQMPEEQILRLSEAFENRDCQAAVELAVRVLNINYGHNGELMKKCRVLSEYAEFVQISRSFATQGANMKTALNQAVDYCVENGILSDFLRKYRAEVLGMLLEEFDAKKYERTLKQEGDIERMIQSVEAVSRNLKITPGQACAILEVTEEEYINAKKGVKS